MHPHNTEPAVKLDMKRGIVFGENQNVLSQIDVLVVDKKTSEETKVLGFDTDMDAILNFTMKNVIMYPKINQVSVQKTKLTFNSTKMMNHNYDSVFESILNDLAVDWNLNYGRGYPLSNINPDLGMIGGLLQNITISPFVSDGWMYGGFSMFADNPIKEVEPLKFLY